MSDVVVIDAELRNETGTGAAREARRTEKLPAVLYGNKKDPVTISVNPRQLGKELEKGGFFAKLVDLKIGGKNERAIPKAIQFHPVTDVPLHIDFLRVSAKSKVTVNIPLHFLNEETSPGIKRGGVLNIVFHDLEVSCPANAMPDHIDIDLDGLEIHDSIHLHDLKLPTGVEPLHAERDATIATIVAPSSVRSEASEEADEDNDTEAIEGDSKEDDS